MKPHAVLRKLQTTLSKLNQTLLKPLECHWKVWSLFKATFLAKMTDAVQQVSYAIFLDHISERQRNWTLNWHRSTGHTLTVLRATSLEGCKLPCKSTPNPVVTCLIKCQYTAFRIFLPREEWIMSWPGFIKLKSKPSFFFSKHVHLPVILWLPQ